MPKFYYSVVIVTGVWCVKGFGWWSTQVLVFVFKFSMCKYDATYLGWKLEAKHCWRKCGKRTSKSAFDLLHNT